MRNLIVSVTIVALCLGGFGGSLQPVRIYLILSFLYLLIFHAKSLLRHSPLYSMGVMCYIYTIFYGLISLSWSANVTKGFFSEILVMSIGMVSLPIFDSLANRPLIHQTVRNSWVIGLAFTLIFAVYELGSGNHFESSDSERILGGSDLYVPFASVFFGNYNNYCAYICLAFPMGLWVLYDTDSAKAKCGVFFILLLAALIVTVNTSRAAMILIALYVAAFSLRNFKFRFRHIFWIIGICIILYTALNNELLGTLVKYRMSNFLGEGDESTRLRLSVFMAGVDMVVQTYGFGVGAGGFTTEILASKYYEDLVDPHNLIIELTSQYGIFSFLFFLNWLSMIYRQATRNNFISPNAKLSVHISLLAVPIIGIMNSHALGYTYWWVFFSGLTLISGYDSGNARKIVKVPNNPI